MQKEKELEKLFVVNKGVVVMPKGTIIYIGGFELPDKDAASHRVLNIGKAFRDCGYDVVYISESRELEVETPIEITYDLVQGFKTWYFPYPKSTLQWAHYISSIKSFKMICSKFDDVVAVVCYNYPAIAFINLCLFCNKKGIRVIGDCTEWYDAAGDNIIAKLIKGIDINLRMRVIQKKTDGLIVISSFLKNYYSKCKNVICIPPLADLDEEKWNITETKQNNEIVEFVYSGNPGRYKDKINIVLKSLALMNHENNYKFYIIGISKEQYLEIYPDDAELLKTLDNHVEFLGRKPHDECLEYIKKADFFIFIRERTRVNQAGFPTKFVESISCGTPVITTDTSDLKCYLKNGKNGFIIENIDGISECLRNVFEIDAAEIKKMKENCANSQMFSYKKYASIIEAFTAQVFK